MSRRKYGLVAADDLHVASVRGANMHTGSLTGHMAYGRAAPASTPKMVHAGAQWAGMGKAGKEAFQTNYARIRNSQRQQGAVQQAESDYFSGDSIRARTEPTMPGWKAPGVVTGASAPLTARPHEAGFTPQMPAPPSRMDKFNQGRVGQLIDRRLAGRL